MQMNAGGCCCGTVCGRAVTYPQASAQLESDFYYALNTPSNTPFYNPVTGLTMLYTDTTGNLGTLDDVGIVMLRPTSICTWSALRYGTGELQAFILRGHTVAVVIELSSCFTAAHKTLVDGWLSSLGGSSISIVRSSNFVGCQTVTNIAASNNINSDMATWRTGGTSDFLLSGSAAAVVTASTFSGNKIIVAATVSSLSGNTLNGKVLAMGDDNSLDTCANTVSPKNLFDGICAAFGQAIA